MRRVYVNDMLHRVQLVKAALEREGIQSRRSDTTTRMKLWLVTAFMLLCMVPVIGLALVIGGIAWLIALGGAAAAAIVLAGRVAVERVRGNRQRSRIEVVETTEIAQDREGDSVRV